MPQQSARRTIHPNLSLLLKLRGSSGSKIAAVTAEINSNLSADYFYPEMAEIQGV